MFMFKVSVCVCRWVHIINLVSGFVFSFSEVEQQFVLIKYTISLLTGIFVKAEI